MYASCELATQTSAPLTRPPRLSFSPCIPLAASALSLTLARVLSWRLESEPVPSCGYIKAARYNTVYGTDQRGRKHGSTGSSITCYLKSFLSTLYTTPAVSD